MSKPSQDIKLRYLIMHHLHPLMCSDHQDRCIGYPDHKREVDETAQAIQSLIDSEVNKARISEVEGMAVLAVDTPEILPTLSKRLAQLTERGKDE